MPIQIVDLDTSNVVATFDTHHYEVVVSEGPYILTSEDKQAIEDGIDNDEVVTYDDLVDDHHQAMLDAT